MSHSGLFKRIREACREVAERARFVRIDRNRLEAYAASLPLDTLGRPTLDPAFHYLDKQEGTAAFVLTLDAINFGSGYFPHLRKKPGCSGYFTIAAGLNEYFHRHGPIPAARLAVLRAADCATLFDQDWSDVVVRELMELFARALNDLGQLLLDRFHSRFEALITHAKHSAEALVVELRSMPFFEDVWEWSGIAVPFYKRAQLSAADLALAFNGEGLGRFDDLAELTIFADNLIPHVLRLDGVLQYHPELAARIDREELIPAGSTEEVELRACAVHSVELLAAVLRRRGGPTVNATHLDYFLWNRGQQPYYKQAKPRHRTRTTSY